LQEEACKLAWQLLTEVYKLQPERLFVTYFGGDALLGVPADLLTRDTWLSIGSDTLLFPFTWQNIF
jgi:alanyl-tRNA synthetase